jgi:hypothetical protein
MMRTRNLLLTLGIIVVIINLSVLRILHLPETSQLATNQTCTFQQDLDKANKEIESLQRQLKDMKLQQQQQATSTTTNSTLYNNTITPNLPKKISPMCSRLPQPIPSTLAIWRANLDRILQASQHPNDHHYILHDFTAELLHLVSQQGRIQRSIVGVPHDYTAVQRVMQLVQDRYHFLHHGGSNNENYNDSGEPNVKIQRKVKILVMGGSLVVGVNCRKIVSEHRLGILMPHRLCTWAHRLEYFLNNALGADIFEVHKIAMGGTNTGTGFVLWESDFLPPEDKHPDIVINAYSTNDMHILTVMEAASSNTTLRDKVMDMTQEFVRSIMKEGDCAPLMLHMDDYLGNEQRDIQTTLHLSQAVQTLSTYYGFAAMSYANVVRDLVYGDTKEAWFSPGGWYEGNTMVREIHPGMGMHIVSSWVAAYTLMNLALTYCTIEEWEMDPPSLHENKIPYQAIQGLPELKNTSVIPGKPKSVPRGLMPPLTPDLNLDEVTDLWRSAPVSRDICVLPEDQTAKCPFSWISGISKDGRNSTHAKEIFDMFSIKGTSWTVDDSGDKVGMSPSESKHMILEFSELNQSIHSITIFYLKSYGEKWDQSEIALSAMLKEGDNWHKVRTDPLFGFHAKHTSETYSHKMELDVKEGVDFRVSIELVGGRTFKVMGLAVCK